MDNLIQKLFDDKNIRGELQKQMLRIIKSDDFRNHFKKTIKSEFTNNLSKILGSIFNDMMEDIESELQGQLEDEFVDGFTKQIRKQIEDGSYKVLITQIASEKVEETNRLTRKIDTEKEA